MSGKLDIVAKLQKMLDGHDSDEICLTVNVIREAIDEIIALRMEVESCKEHYRNAFELSPVTPY